jgi:S1-C subfamily serine protease
LRGIDEQGWLGDVIVGAKGKPVGSVADLSAVLDRVGIGNRARLTIIRAGTRQEVAATVLDIS